MSPRGPKLEKQQVLLGRFVDIGAELFAISATCARAATLGGDTIGVAEYFCRNARLRIDQLFHDIHHNTDRMGYRVAQGVLKGECEWLEDGMLR